MEISGGGGVECELPSGDKRHCAVSLWCGAMQCGVADWSKQHELQQCERIQYYQTASSLPGLPGGAVAIQDVANEYRTI